MQSMVRIPTPQGVGAPRTEEKGSIRVRTQWRVGGLGLTADADKSHNDKLSAFFNLTNNKNNTTCRLAGLGCFTQNIYLQNCLYGIMSQSCPKKFLKTG